MQLPFVYVTLMVAPPPPIDSLLTNVCSLPKVEPPSVEILYRTLVEASGRAYAIIISLLLSDEITASSYSVPLAADIVVSVGADEQGYAQDQYRISLVDLAPAK